MHCMLSLVKIEGASKLVLKYILIALVSRPPSRVKAFLLQEDILIQKYHFETKMWQSIVKITCYWQCIERQLRGDIGFSVIRFCWRGDSSPCLPELSPVDIVLGRHVGGVWQCLEWRRLIFFAIAVPTSVFMQSAIIFRTRLYDSGLDNLFTESYYILRKS